LTKAVRRRLISDVPLGAFLSGGLDSSIVVHLLSKLTTGEPPRTFSIQFEGDSRYNEAVFANQAAARFGTRHQVFTVTAQSFGLLERLVWHHDQPFGDSSAVPTYLLSQLARSQVTVALTGDGGDELFAGYDRFTASLLAERIPRPLRVAASRLARRLPAGASQKSVWTRLHRFCLTAHLPLPDRLLSWMRTFPDSGSILREEYRQPDPPLAVEQGATPLQQLLRINFHDYLPNDLHVKLDRCSMAHGLETRSPFLDTRLIEWSFSLPDRFKWRSGVTKWILREAFRNDLPRPILSRAKMGFGVPLESWFRGSWKEPLHDLLTAGQPRLLRYLRPEALRGLLLRHDAGLVDAGHRLWLLLTLEVWLRSLERPVDVVREGAPAVSCP
jgi:asparagine synthase (glutamine-hydrolysing)